MNDDIARRFPLVPRPRPACGPLAERVRDVAVLARSAREATGPARQTLTARAWNNAALIASDCGLPDLARSLCWRHYEVWAPAQPLDAAGARHAIEPLINLARLRIRADDGSGAHQQLEALHHAVRTQSDTVIDGKAVSFATLTRTTEDHGAFCRWLWTVVLAEGIRALTRDGLWHRALVHAERHRGLGRRLLDGRQIAVLSRLASGDCAAAITALDGSTPIAPWEHAVAACLTVFCQQGLGEITASALSAAVQHYLHLRPVVGFETFRFGLALAIVDLAGVGHPGTELVAAHIIRETIQNRDELMARRILVHPICAATMSDESHRALRETASISRPRQLDVGAHLMMGLLGVTPEDPSPEDSFPQSRQGSSLPNR